MVRVAILGASGYTALELCKLLLRHGEVEITALTTRQAESPPLADVHPALAGRLDLRLENLPPAEVAERAECVFSCLPHGASAAAVAPLLDAGRRVVDFSADYRFHDLQTYQQWYGVEHPDPGRLRTAVYGLPEFYRQVIPEAELVANPGCYPTAAILALAPLLRARAIEPEGIIVDSKSGVSGAGRQPKPHLHFPECNESVAAYGVGTHRHMPEIDQTLTHVATDWEKGEPPTVVNVLFTPHLIPMDRGILSTNYAVPVKEMSGAAVLDVLRVAYHEEPFVRVVDELPTTKQVADTNYCDITARAVRGRVVVISAIDNLIKGAAGAAVQNFNLMYGFAEETGLT